MESERTHGVSVEAWEGFAHVTTMENDIGRSVELDPDKMRNVADMLYELADRMEDGEV